MTDYWLEALEIALDDEGLLDAIPKKARENIAGSLEISHENYGMAHGHDAIPNPRDADIERLKAAHKREIEEFEALDAAYRKGIGRLKNVDPRRIYVDRGEVMISRD